MEPVRYAHVFPEGLCHRHSALKFHTFFSNSHGPCWQNRTSTPLTTVSNFLMCSQESIGRSHERASDRLSNRSTHACAVNILMRAHHCAFTNRRMLPFRLVEKYGEGSWSRLVPYFQGRIGKQLRERWNHELRPDIMKGAWTQEEEAMLVVQHCIHKNAWADIAKVTAAHQCSCRQRLQNGLFRAVLRCCIISCGCT